MPKDNEVNEKVTPVAWVERTEGGLTRMWSGDLSAWAHRPANPEPLYSAATVAELRAKADAAERRVGELTSLLSDTVGNLRRMANDEFADCEQVRLEHVVNRIEDHLTGADPT